MGENGVFVFPDAATGHAASSIDPNLLLALQNNGGFGGGNGAWWWIMFMWMMWDRNGRNGNFNDYLASVNGNEGRQYLADIMNGRFDNLNNLANMLNTSVEGIKAGVYGLQNSITQVAGQIGMSGLQTINAIQAGNTSILSKLCECCCENRLAICQQTNALQSTLAANHADDILQAEKNAAGLQLQLAQLDGADKLAICQQTNTLQNKDNSKAVEAQTKEYEKAVKKVKELEDKIKAAENAQEKFEGMRNTAAEKYNDLTREISAARKEQEKLIEEGKSQGKARNVVQFGDQYKQWGDVIKKLQSEQTILTNTQQSASKSIDKQSESLISLNEQLRLARTNADEEAQALEKEKIAAGATAADIQKLRNEIAQLTNTKADTLPQTLVELKAHLNDLIAKEGDTSQFADIIGQINQKLEQGTQQGQQFNQVFNETVRGPVQNMVAMNSEMDQLKNRFQYFFSAINGIQLFKRAIRDAFDSVKELDAAMTEMAVVTDYTIGDIWKQIDQYTSEANKLGATTTDVIKSMVLYTQQGLDMAQATQLSTETMKMARIAGLEGAEATDLRKHWVFI